MTNENGKTFEPSKEKPGLGVCVLSVPGIFGRDANFRIRDSICETAGVYRDVHYPKENWMLNEYLESLQQKVLQEKRQGKKVVLLGVSMGGAIAAYGCLSNKVEADGLILLCVPSQPNDMNSKVTRLLDKVFGTNTLLGKAGSRGYELFLKVSQPQMNTTEKQLYTQAMSDDPSLLAGRYRNFSLSLNELGKMEGTSSTPVLRVEADKDAWIDYQNSRFGKLFTNQTVKKVSGLHGDLQNYQSAQEYRQAITTWLKKTFS